MLTFYNHRGIRVTDEWIIVDGHRYPVRELEDLRVTRGPLNRPAMWLLGSGGSLLGMAVLLGPVLPGLTIAALGVVGLLVAGGGAALARLRPREWRLWIQVRGNADLLLATRDGIELGKLRRAVCRSLERAARFHRMSTARRARQRAGAGLRIAA